jgi:hypothetical protein
MILIHKSSSSTESKIFTANKNNLFAPDLSLLDPRRKESLSVSLQLQQLDEKELEDLEKLKKLGIKNMAFSINFLYVYVHRFNTEKFLILSFLDMIENFLNHFDNIYNSSDQEQKNILNEIKENLIFNLKGKKILAAKNNIIGNFIHGKNAIEEIKIKLSKDDLDDDLKNCPNLTNILKEQLIQYA